MGRGRRGAAPGASSPVCHRAAWQVAVELLEEGRASLHFTMHFTVQQSEHSKATPKIAADLDKRRVRKTFPLARCSARALAPAPALFLRDLIDRARPPPSQLKQLRGTPRPRSLQREARRGAQRRSSRHCTLRPSRGGGGSGQTSLRAWRQQRSTRWRCRTARALGRARLRGHPRPRAPRRVRATPRLWARATARVRGPARPLSRRGKCRGAGA